MPDSPRPVCLITGGARRIGAAIAEAVAPHFDVAAHYLTSQDEAEALCARLAGPGRTLRPFRADLAEAEEAAGLVRDVAHRFGRLDLVVNGASVFEHDTPADFDAATMQRHLAVNLVAPMVIAREFAALAGEGALLVNMLDNAVFSPNPDYFSYSLAKFALKGSIDMLAMQHRGRLRVCGIAPGVTLVSGGQTRENFERSWRRSLTGTGATPGQIGATVLFLWRNPAINAATIVLDGGQRLLGLERDVAFLVEE